jgi:hypothetical protein
MIGVPLSVWRGLCGAINVAVSLLRYSSVFIGVSLSARNRQRGPKISARQNEVAIRLENVAISAFMDGASRSAPYGFFLPA